MLKGVMHRQNQCHIWAATARKRAPGIVSEPTSCNTNSQPTSRPKILPLNHVLCDFLDKLDPRFTTKLYPLMIVNFVAPSGYSLMYRHPIAVCRSGRAPTSFSQRRAAMILEVCEGDQAGPWSSVARIMIRSNNKWYSE